MMRIRGSWNRRVFALVVGGLLVGVIAGLAIVIASSARVGTALAYVLLGIFGVTAAVCLGAHLKLFVRTEELEQANAALGRRNEVIEQAKQAKSNFLADMSHELRTPLNAIIGFADLMHEERLGPVSDEHRESLDDIRSSARHLLHLINEVLDLARIESGRISFDPTPLEPTAIAAECVDTLRSLASDGNVDVVLEPRPVGTVSLDAARLRQVLLNYLSNAIKFTPSGGRVAVSFARDANELVLEVTDTGPGIEWADQGGVFAEFEQLRRRGNGGTGLGLAVTKRIVEAQGGEVGVRSVPGHGATFFARLPVATGSSSPERSRGEAPTALAMPRGRG
jgi:signal transduction histidine kinase